MKAVREFLAQGLVTAYGFIVGGLIGEADMHGLYKVLEDQGSLIAGGLAIIAAVMTVKATQASADREVAAAQHQIKTTLILEKRRLAREGHAVNVLVHQAACIVLQDLDDANDHMTRYRRPQTESAWYARHAFSRSGFDEVPTLYTYLHGEVVSLFLNLKRATDRFESRSYIHGNGDRIGEIHSLRSELAIIQDIAIRLRDLSQSHIKLCLEELAATQDLIEIDPPLSPPSNLKEGTEGIQA